MKVITLILLIQSVSAMAQITTSEYWQNFHQKDAQCRIAKITYEDCMGELLNTRNYFCEDNLGKLQAEISLEHETIHLKYQGENLVHTGIFSERIITELSRLNGYTEFSAHIKDSYKPDGTKSNHTIRIFGIKAPTSDDYHFNINHVSGTNLSVTCFLN